VPGGGVLVASVTLLGSLAKEPRPAAPEAAPARPSSDPGEDFYAERLMPRFELTNQDGQPVTQEIFEPGVVIVDFMFTNCPTICPIMTGVMADLNDRLADTGVKFVSISVDPAHDTPETLREYGGRVDADFDRWTFLTGDFATVENIVEGALSFNLSTNPDQQVSLRDGSQMDFIIHPAHLVLVRSNRDIVNIYKFDDAEAIDRLEERARWEDAAVSGG
jgi:protein SCO1/2